MPSAQNLQVLCVDDQHSMRQLIRYHLDQIGIRQVVDSKDGADALTQMQNKRFDLIISDWNMEGMDGFELLQQIRADPLAKKTPFIMVTGENSKEQVKKAIDAGVNNYVLKPLSTQTLKQKIEAVLGPLK